jgi:hypothetical protein
MFGLDSTPHDLCPSDELIEEEHKNRNNDQANRSAAINHRDSINIYINQNNIVGTRKASHNTKTKENLLTSAFRYFLKKTKKTKKRDSTNVLLGEIIEYYVEFQDLFKDVINMICNSDVGTIET